MFVLVRAVTYAALFIGLVLMFLPARILSPTGLVRPQIGVWQVAGMLVGAAGATLALTCRLASRSSVAGLPRRSIRLVDWSFGVRIVDSGTPCMPGLALSSPGAALYYHSMSLLGYAALFLSRTCSSCCTKSPRCGGRSGKRTRRTVGKRVCGGRHDEQSSSPPNTLHPTAAGARAT